MTETSRRRTRRELGTAVTSRPGREGAAGVRRGDFVVDLRARVIRLQGRTMPYAVPDSQVKCRPPPLKWTVLLLQGNTAALISIIKTTVPSKANVYTVTVENRCICTQANIKLACSGFNSSVAIDLAGVLNVDGDGKLCTLNGGHPIGMGPEYAVKFSYASPSGQFGFKPVSSSIACS